MAFAGFYGSGRVMGGASIADVDDMSLWEFAVSVDAWNRAHGDNKPEPPSDEEFREFTQQSLAVH